MDFGTIIGILLGSAFILLAIVLGSGLDIFIHAPSLMITVGGTIAATLINFPLKQVLNSFKVVRKVIRFQVPSPLEEISKMVRYSRIARKEGLLALENDLETIEDPFSKGGIQLLVDGVDPEAIRRILDIEIEHLERRHMEGKKILEAMGMAAPAFGMIGTLIGLVHMLKNMADPSMIGAGMATALLTTFYGALMANLILIPLAGKLGQRNGQEVLNKEIFVEGIISIQSGDSPRLVEDKLKAFLMPKLRKEPIE